MADRWLRRVWQRIASHGRLAQEPATGRGAISNALWQTTLENFPFLAQRPAHDVTRLRQWTSAFLRDKEFTGAHGLEITDRMAVAIAAQACLPILHLGARPPQALAWYGDFVGIVVHAGEVVAQRETVDSAGVVQSYKEVLAGEAMEGGPVTLAWQAVAEGGTLDGGVFNVVIHEFAHKIDMRDGVADGCPPLPAGFLGATTARAARAAWAGILQPAYADFREQAIVAERFGGAPTWLDPYGAESIGEFFAVACEGYFVQRERFGREFPTLMPLFDQFFRRGPVTASKK
jgi:MtfA peptidase